MTSTLRGAALALALAVCGLAACSPKSSDMSGPMAPVAAPAAEAPADGRAFGGSEKMVDAVDAEVSADKPTEPPSPTPQQPGTPPGAPMLAYAYTYGLEVPPAAVGATMKAHQDTCVNAGAGQCQVLASSTNSYGQYDIRAHLELRGEPRWLKQFRDHLQADAEKAGGKITATNTTTEDLTRQIVDTEAGLRAQKTLRDRLQALLASRPGKLSELLEVERELARVQGEIDAQESNLAVMRARVSMSLLTIDYVSSGAPVTDTTFKPIGDALQNFFGYIASGIAIMITLIAVLAPWGLLAWLVVWLVLRWRRKRNERVAAAAASQPPA